MSDNEDSSLSLISDIAGVLPPTVKTGLLGALYNLLGGLTAIPAAWLKGHAQSIEDKTAARSAFSAAVAKSVTANALADPIAMQAAAEIYIPSAVRKGKNKLKVALKAAEHASGIDNHTTNPATPDDDWMNTFIRFAEDASSERLQDLFGRILAGQVIKPGSFCLSTIRTISELDTSIAQDFSLVWAKSVGKEIDYSAEFGRGEWFARWKRLAEAGLMAPEVISQYLPTNVQKFNGNFLWSPVQVDDKYLVVHFSENCTAKWDHIVFTRVGREIGSIIAPPDFTTNMRAVGHKLALPGVVRVELHSKNNSIEVIYAAPSH